MQEYALLFVLIVFISCLVLHFRQHYRLNICARAGDVPQNMPPTGNPVFSGHRSGSEIEAVLYDITHNQKLIKLFIPVNGEEFHFFPASFVYYLLYSIALSILVTIGNHESLTTHWLIVYGILILSVWDSFFSWYRYYSTLFISTYFRHVETTIVLKYFMAYGAPYILLFIIQIHFFYYLFPLVLLVHLIFNCWCTWRFACVLIESYHDSIDAFSPEMYDRVLKDAYFMRSVQFICNILSSVSLACILNISTPWMTHWCPYIPIIWSVADVFITLNFARNKVFIIYAIRTAYRKILLCIRCNHTKAHEERVGSDHPTTTEVEEVQIEPSLPPTVDSLSINSANQEYTIQTKTSSLVLPKQRASKSAVSLNSNANNRISELRIQSLSAPVPTDKRGTLANDLEKPMITKPPPLIATKSHPLKGSPPMKPVVDVLRRATSAPAPWNTLDERNGMEDRNVMGEETKDVVSLPTIELEILSMNTVKEWQQTQETKFKINTKGETIQTQFGTGKAPVTPVTPAVDACWDVLSAQGFLDMGLANTIRRSALSNRTEFPM
eukprot:104491_1